MSNERAKYIMIGGFLGAGKSTAIMRFADYLKGKGQNVGLITNDQSIGLVDTENLRAKGFDVEEIAGGCFCCRFDSLVDAVQNLKQMETTPDVFLAEPVGSCTDLVATVSYPLRRMYGRDYAIAPLSVLVDPIRARRVLGLDATRQFSEKVCYVYTKQLEEADVIVVNKTDLLAGEELGELDRALNEQFPNAEIIHVSARTGEGLEAWFEQVLEAEIAPHTAMDIDYQTYAEGEALLGWLNATVILRGDAPFDGERYMMDLAKGIHTELDTHEAEVAHLKMTLLPDSQMGHIASLNLVRNDFVPEMSQSLPEQMSSGKLVVNLRAEADPELLHEILKTQLDALDGEGSGVGIELEHVDYFRPAPPEPTHRIAEPA